MATSLTSLGSTAVGTLEDLKGAYKAFSDQSATTLDRIGGGLNAITGSIGTLDTVIQALKSIPEVELEAELPLGLSVVAFQANLVKVSDAIANMGVAINAEQNGAGSIAQLTSGTLQLISSFAGVVGSFPGGAVAPEVSIIANGLAIVTGEGADWLAEPEHAELVNGLFTGYTEAITTPTVVVVGQNPSFSEFTEYKYDSFGNVIGSETWSGAVGVGSETETIVSKVNGNDVSISYGFDSGGNSFVQNLNSINGQAVDSATNAAFVFGANNLNTDTSDTGVENYLDTVLPTLNFNLNGISTPTTDSSGSQIIHAINGDVIDLSNSSQYVSETTTPGTDSTTPFNVDYTPQPPTTGGTPNTSVMDGITIVDNGDGTYSYTLPLSAGSESIADAGNALYFSYTNSKSELDRSTFHGGRLW